MVKNKMLASWVYRQGELARQRLVKKTAVIAFIALLVLVIIVIFPLLFSGAFIIKNILARVILIILLFFAVLVYCFPGFFSGLLFKGIKKIATAADEEVIITSEKIITEKKTWMLNNEKKELRSVEWDNAAKPGELIFRGRESIPGEADKRFLVRLPVPPHAYHSGEKIYQYFKQLLGGVAGPGDISG
jgi:hypothetical protein